MNHWADRVGTALAIVVVVTLAVVVAAAVVAVGIAAVAWLVEAVL